MADRELPQQYNQIISALPCNKEWRSPLRNYNGSWHPEKSLPGTLAFRDHFRPRDTDIFIVSPPKSGTTWLKALTFAAVKRKDHDPSANDHPLYSMNPHDCVPFVNRLYLLGDESKLDHLDSPRLLHTHLVIQNLPESMIRSDCKIIYICRDPKDTFVSTWHFTKRLTPEGQDPASFGEVFELYCNGVSPFGPVWDHQLGYWKESLTRPEKVLFLKYEEMMKDPSGNLKKLAEFVGYPFSEAEEKEGVVEEIVKLCSFENLSGLDVNRTGSRYMLVRATSVKNSVFFRKGKVGDWMNHLTPEMVRRLDEITAKKLHGFGLTFCTHVDTDEGDGSIQNERGPATGAGVTTQTKTKSEST